MSEYSCSTKLVWMLENLDKLKEHLSNPETRDQVKFGTVDSWLMWKLTQGMDMLSVLPTVVLISIQKQDGQLPPTYFAPFHFCKEGF